MKINKYFEAESKQEVNELLRLAMEIKDCGIIDWEHPYIKEYVEFNKPAGAFKALVCSTGMVIEMLFAVVAYFQEYSTVNE